jgi:hypothetical protein
MDSVTRSQLIATIIMALVVTILWWYISTRPNIYQSAQLEQISFAPADSLPAQPYLTFTFGQPLDISRVTNSTAALKSFMAAPGLSQDAQTLLSSLLGQKGSIPFVPTVMSPLVITTNTLPSGNLPTNPVTVVGAGIMWFVMK